MNKLILISALLAGSLTALKANVSIANGCQVVMNNSQLVVNGSWNNPGSGFTQNSGQVIFGGSESTNSSVLHNGAFKNVAVNKTGSGALSLNSNLNINGTLTMQSGKVLTNTHTLDLGTTGLITGEATGRYVVGKLSSTRLVGTAGSTFGGVGINLNGGSTNLGTVTLLRTTGPAAITDINGSSSIARKWLFSGAASDEVRNTTFTWLPEEQQSGGNTGFTLWHTDDGNQWHSPSEFFTYTPQTYSLAIKANGTYTAASSSPVNLMPLFMMEEDISKSIFIANAFKGTGKYTGYLDNATIWFQNGSQLQLVRKGSSSRSYTLSVSGNSHISVTFNAGYAYLTPEQNWNGTENLKFILTETAKSLDAVNKSGGRNKSAVSLSNSKALESFYDIMTVKVNPVNDAPAIISCFPALQSFSTTQSNVKFSIKAGDVDNPFSGLNFKWFVKKGSGAEVQQASIDSVFTSNFTEAAIYTVKAQVSDGLLSATTSWTVDANPSSIYNDALPTVTKLEQNYPNPFNPQTSITYSLKEASPVNISIYNHTGQLVKTLVSGTQNAGYYSAVWDASAISSGIYFYQMKAGDYQMIKRAVVIK